jgi:hypothetical protein
MGIGVDSRALRRHVVRIDRVDGAVCGTGFFVAPGWVLSAAHVVGDADRVRVVPDVSVSDRPVDAVVVARSGAPDGTALWPYPDLALLRLAEAVNHPCVWLHPGDPVEGCHAWGFPPREYGVPPPGSPATFVFEGVEDDGYLRLKAGPG